MLEGPPFMRALLTCMFLATSAQATDCRTAALELLLVRAPYLSVNSADIEQQLLAFSESPIIRSLEKIHVEGYQLFSRGFKRRTFHPTWIFSSREAMETILDQFPSGFEQGIEAFVRQWERDYVKAGGQVSKLWVSKSREAFVRRMLLELAYHHQTLEQSPGNQPVHFRYSEADELSLVPGAAEIINAFGSIQAFQTQ